MIPTAAELGPKPQAGHSAQPSKSQQLDGAVLLPAGNWNITELSYHLSTLQSGQYPAFFG
jgi:hypothetical protein